jgi:hypothetical protein
VVDASLDDIGELCILVTLVGFPFAEVKRAEGGKILEPFSEIALVGKTQQVGYFLNGHICVLQQVASID